MPDLPDHPSHRSAWTDRVTLVALVAVLATVLGLSPGLALIGVALIILLLDAYAPPMLDLLMARTRP